MFKVYYQLVKPGIIYGNAMTAIAGFFLASKGSFDLKLFLAMLVGLSLIIASACVFNNYTDQEMDKHMARTKTRALASGTISNRNAITFGIILGLLGISLFLYFHLFLPLFLALIGFITYVFLYTPLKSKTLYATLVGSISGAVPIVVGYTAVTGLFNTAALLLFIILVCWQMPHFYAIAIYRIQDYISAKVPVLPVRKGVATAKIHIVFYIIIFTLACLLLTYYKITGYSFAVVSLLLGLSWLRLAMNGFKAKIDSTAWAKKVFLFSLIIITVLSLTLTLNVILP